MSKEKFIKNVSELKDQATKVGSDAKKTIEKLKGAVQVGISTSKTVINKAGETINKQSLGDGIEKASAGVNIVAKGARVVASTMENASDKMRKMSDKLKKK